MSKINFDTLPNSKPAMGNVIPKGNYLATIVKAEMKQPKDETKPMYFSAECDITDPVSNTKMGKFWLRLFESEAPLIQYQIKRFIQAIGLQISGEFELRDLTKIVNGAKLMVDLMPEERKDGREPQNTVVDISAECFYPVGEVKNAESTTNEEIIEAATEILSADTPAPTMPSSNY